MSGAYVFRKLRAAAGRFIGARKGNVAVIFALSAIPIISFVGAAIDYTRATAAKSAMQAALDSTALMLSKTAASLSPLERGRGVYKKYGCAGCHGPDAQGGVPNPNAKTAQQVPGLVPDDHDPTLLAIGVLGLAAAWLGGERFVFLKDPDGLDIELLEYLERP